MIYTTDTLPVLSTTRKYLLSIAILVITAIEVIAFYRGNINIFSGSMNVWQVLIAVCVLIILYVLLSYYLQSDERKSMHLDEPLIIQHEVKKESIVEVQTRDAEKNQDSILQNEISAVREDTANTNRQTQETIQTLLSGFTNELKLNNEKNEADVLKYFIEKIEKEIDEFSIVIYTGGNRQVYMGLDAVTIHLDRIANFYNDHDQFKGDLTRYDAQLLNAIEFGDSTIRRIEIFRPEHKYFKEQLTEFVKLVYKNKLEPVFEKYEQMISKVENKNAKLILQSLSDRITETKFSMEMLEKAVF